MCRTAIKTHPYCKCRWVTIERPCRPGAGFSTCSSFSPGHAHQNQRQRVGLRCPVHDMHRRYDFNTVRMITRTKKTRDKTAVDIRVCEGCVIM
ncbi:hypothetical protein NKR23_g8875 [Pleurostoma richardsiae]|uniref:Uncharacterized protein n=1 Tax=Pleurostoma richardsiae TaxID=41990 RepID=A0AA38RS21_9PEZI|nr:hypothetical protein NKR23_g8875 [Pleurostoma richardsiae]